MASPLAGYTRPQRRVIRALDREADTRGYRGLRGRTLRLAAYETGLVETSLRNLPYGSGSSKNWRQETAESYPNVDRMNLPGSVDRYFDEAEAAYHKGIKPGVLSQAVQRSAFPGRYAQQGGQARDLLRATRAIDWPGGVRGGGAAGGVMVQGPGYSRETVEPQQGVSALLRALKEESGPQVPTGSALAPPAVSAAPALPAGYQPVQSSGPPAPPKPDISELMALVQPGAGLPKSTITPGSVSGLAGLPGGNGRMRGLPHYGPSGGRDVNVSGSPIDRAGVSTKPYVLHAVDYIGDILGSPIKPGTGTAHDQYTVNNNVSDHWGGGAVDLPSIGKRLYAIGRSALIAAGMDPKKARHATGGLYNINGWQIIFATTEGGDHWDHVHVAPPSGWKRPR